MGRLLAKDQILTVPNLMSLIRLALIPVIVHLYCTAQNYTAAVAIIILSGLTDLADGVIARRCGKVTDLGKILDPVADKLTQGALMICLAIKYRWMRYLLLEFILKEAAMIAMGCATIKKKGQVNSAQWFGKTATAVLYGMMCLLIFFPNMSLALANTLIAISGIMVAVSLMLSGRFYRGVLRVPGEGQR